jgi:hypothetical protein
VTFQSSNHGVFLGSAWSLDDERLHSSRTYVQGICEISSSWRGGFRSLHTRAEHRLLGSDRSFALGLAGGSRAFSTLIPAARYLWQRRIPLPVTSRTSTSTKPLSCPRQPGAHHRHDAHASELQPTRRVRTPLPVACAAASPRPPPQAPQQVGARVIVPTVPVTAWSDPRARVDTPGPRAGLAGRNVTGLQEQAAMPPAGVALEPPRK